jgi:hypothetical protein
MPRPVEGGVREATHHASLEALVVNLILREALSGIGPVSGGSTYEQRGPHRDRREADAS